MQANLIIVTGDVTDRGDIESWKIFWKEIKEAGLSEKVLVVPGNHDVCCLRARLPFKKKTHRRKDLEKTSIALQMGNQETEFPWARKFDGCVVVFGLNSNNAGNISILSNAIGRVGHSQLLSFAQKLHTHHNVPVKIVVLHHSPKIPHKSASKKRGGKIVNRLLFTGRQIPARQRRVLLMLCLSQGVKLIVHGHVHKAHEHVVNRIHIVGAPPTTQPVHKTAGRNSYQFYTYTIERRDGRISTKLRTIEI
jgi:predicted phosphodiesterase